MSPACFDNTTCLYNTNTNMTFNQQHLPPINHPLNNKQGIVSVLASDNINSLPPFNNPPIRRTLSADMSSQIWLQTNGLPTSPVKRAKSSLHLQALDQDHQGNHHHNEKGPAFDEIWSSIQASNKSWGCLLSPAAPNNKDGSGSDSGQLAAPYVHPLVKRTGSSLSEKSLEICTESLGSETGSDGFSFPSSDSEHEPEEEDEEVEEEVEIKGCNNNVQQQSGVGVGVGVGINKFVYNNSRGPTTTSKRSMMVPPTRPSSFPPPLPSLTHRDDGSNLHIRSHRKDGRLVVEAVSVPSKNYFRAQRQDGRLLLTFSATTADDDDNDNDDEEVTDDEDVQDKNSVEKVVQVEETMEVMKEEDRGAGGEAGMMKRPAPPPPSPSISCTAAMTMMSKFMFMELANKSTTWPRNYNTAVIKTLNKEDEEEDDEEVTTTMPAVAKQSLPPRPANSNAALNNAYEYYWRRGSSTAVAGMLKPLIAANTSNKKGVGKHTKRNNNKLLYGSHSLKKGSQQQQQQQQQEQVVVPLMQLRGCKEAKKPSLLLWEPHCIATS